MRERERDREIERERESKIVQLLACGYVSLWRNRAYVCTCSQSMRDNKMMNTQVRFTGRGADFRASETKGIAAFRSGRYVF